MLGKKNRHLSTKLHQATLRPPVPLVLQEAQAAVHHPGPPALQEARSAHKEPACLLREVPEGRKVHRAPQASKDLTAMKDDQAEKDPQVRQVRPEAAPEVHQDLQDLLDHRAHPEVQPLLDRPGSDSKKNSKPPNSLNLMVQTKLTGLGRRKATPVSCMAKETPQSMT